jgi:hypothetical protein
MKPISLAAASFVVVSGLGVASALAQAPVGAPPPAPAVPAPQQIGSTPAYPPPSNPAPAGYHYVWTYAYDRHGDYLGHWEAVRDR